MHSITFPGCTPTSLVSYLKALGILRVLAEQSTDREVKCLWQTGSFHLDTQLSQKELFDFFLNSYRPTPVVSPWNAGSGFYFREGKTNEKGVDGKKIKTGVRDQETEATRSITTLRESVGERFESYRKIIEYTKNRLNEIGRIEAPEGDEKRNLVLKIRNSCPDHLLDWIDAAFILSGEDIVPPPLLLSGGNEGNLDFSNTFVQNLLLVIDKDSDLPTENSSRWLANAFFSDATKLESGLSSGYFAPGIRGGANSTTGFSSKSHTNPWDFILTIEGIVLFTGNATKKLASNRYEVSFPFCVKSTGTGFASGEAKEATEGKGEIWLPTWSKASSCREIRSVFSEGRATVGKRTARSGVDFAQAVASLGVDRGLDTFYRYGILPRFGDSYFASPLQHFKVSRNPVITDLLAPCDEWISRFLREAKTELAPGAIQRSARRLESAIFAQACASQERDPRVAQELLVALGECERTISKSSKWREECSLSPLPRLHRAWIKAADTDSVEYRLAGALASLGESRETITIRQQLEPINRWGAWDDSAHNEAAWHEGDIVDVLCEMMRRRLLIAQSASAKSWPEFSKVTAWPDDVAAFIEGRIDEDRFTALLWGLALVDFSGPASKENMPARPAAVRDEEVPPAFYAQLKLCFAARLPGDKKIPVEPIIFNLAANGDGARASEQALRRLHGSSIPVTHIRIPVSGDAAKRAAAALIFPLWDRQLAEVCRAVAPDFFEQPTSSH